MFQYAERHKSFHHITFTTSRPGKISSRVPEFVIWRVQHILKQSASLAVQNVRIHDFGLIDTHNRTNRCVFARHSLTVLWIAADCRQERRRNTACEILTSHVLFTEVISSYARTYTRFSITADTHTDFIPWYHLRRRVGVSGAVRGTAGYKRNCWTAIGTS
jgi:hypothetical protein